ncbi:hypothetical protein HDU98_004677 [Podochytrium sp. JEL0797]|nr:hypothetical protein HDU98_004677 [Podochytrium sp. JEL0797]
MAVISGYILTQLIGKDYVANSLINNDKGVELSSFALDAKLFVPKDGRQLRHLYLASMWLLEAALWVLLLQVKWEGIVTDMGVFPCIPATYLNERDLFHMKDFVEGSASLATIYNYGLPLSDGLVGGFAAWPLAAPGFQFNVQGDGPVYAFKIVCSDSIPVGASPPIGPRDVLSSQILSSMVDASTLTATFSLRIPAHDHNMANFIDRDLVQTCNMTYVITTGLVKFTFVADEWQMVTGGKMQEIEMSNQLVVSQEMSPKLSFEQFMIGLTPGTNVQDVIIMTGFYDALSCLNLTSFSPTQAGKISQLFKWAQNLEGQYDVSQMWQGLAGAIGAISHFQLNQYDGSKTDNCIYSGDCCVLLCIWGGGCDILVAVLCMIGSRG